LALAESLLLVWPRQERQATPVSTWASPQVEPASAEVMKAWLLVPPASELVWVQQQPVWPQAWMELLMPVLASAQEQLVRQSCRWLSRSRAYLARSCAAVPAQPAKFLLPARC
jgi:hypothetical protein